MGGGGGKASWMTEPLMGGCVTGLVKNRFGAHLTWV